jgi:hypothetical protein
VHDHLPALPTAWSPHGRIYDLARQPCRSWLLDAGTTHTIRDATGAPAEQRDDNGALTLAGFDPTPRPLSRLGR